MKEYAKSLADDDVSAGQGISYVLWVMYVCGYVMLMNECLVLVLCYRTFSNRWNENWGSALVVKVSIVLAGMKSRLL
jgi:hypothetical protein